MTRIALIIFVAACVQQLALATKGPRRSLRIVKSTQQQKQRVTGRLLQAKKGSEPVPGSTVTLFKCSTLKTTESTCTQVCSTVTDSSGYYGDSPCFSSVAPTDATFYYKVCIQNPLGDSYDFTGKDPGVQDVTPVPDDKNLACSDPISVPPDTTQVVNGQLNTKPTPPPVKPPTNAPVTPPTTPPVTQLATVTGHAFNDTNGNGSQDGSESSRPGQEVTLLNCDGEVVGVTLTDGNGDFTFSGVAAGSCYTVLFGPDITGNNCKYTGGVSSAGKSDQFALSAGESKNVVGGVYCPPPAVSNAPPTASPAGNGVKAKSCISNDSTPGCQQFNTP